MSAIEEFEAAREDLEALLTEVLGTVAGEEAMPVWDEELPPGPVVSARLAIHDEEEDLFTMIHIRTSAIVARVLASRMLVTAEPGPDDLLDAMGELGNIVGGNVKSLLRHHCRLSLPVAEAVEHDAAAGVPDGVRVQTSVLGQVVEMVLDVPDDVSDLYWPGNHIEDAPLEAQP